jgi:hypothetical protein
MGKIKQYKLILYPPAIWLKTKFCRSVQLISFICISILWSSGCGESTIDPEPELAPLPIPSIEWMSPQVAVVGTTDLKLIIHGERFVPESIVQWGGMDRSTTFISPTEISALIPASDMVKDHVIKVSVLNPKPGGGLSGELDFNLVSKPLFESWILDRSQIASAITWEDIEGEKTYTEWSANDRAELGLYITWAQNGHFPIAELPENTWAPHLQDSEFPTTVLSKRSARELFLAHVAQSIWLESSQRLPWSLLEYAQEDLKTLLSSRSLFTRIDPENGRPGGYRLRNIGLPAPPDVGFEFLVSNNLIGPNRRETINNVIGWSRGMIHFLGGYQAGTLLRHWQYRGVPPLLQVLKKTIATEHPSQAELGPRHWTAGCHGTNMVLRDLLRVINIPVDYVNVAGHATPSFPSEGLFLSHGDDPYSRILQGFGPLPTNAEILIDKPTWTRWFDIPSPRENIARQVYELSQKYLTQPVVYAYCQDKSNDTPRQSSQVFAIYKHIYTLAELEEQDLWKRLEQRVLDLGGCQNVTRL